MVFDTFVLHPSRAPKWEFSPFVKSKRAIFYKAYNFLRADFVARVKFRPQWVGQSDGSEGSVEESVSLQPVGWQEMMQRIVKIQVEYQPPEVYPGKPEVRLPSVAVIRVLLLIHAGLTAPQDSWEDPEG